jgi:hypothetical protein
LTPQPSPGPSLPALPPPLSAADMLHALADTSDGDTITIEEILTALGNQGFGLLVLVLALPNAIPGPIIPGFSVPFALGIVILSVQLLRGHRRPLLPSWLLRRRIRRERFKRFVVRAEPALRRFERWFKPRPARFMAQRPADRPRTLGGVLIAFALVLALPIPLGNGPQAFALCVVALGMFEGDEKVETAGIVLGVLSMLLNAAIVIAGVQIFAYVTKHL